MRVFDRQITALAAISSQIRVGSPVLRWHENNSSYGEARSIEHCSIQHASERMLLLTVDAKRVQVRLTMCTQKLEARPALASMASAFRQTE